MKWWEHVLSPPLYLFGGALLLFLPLITRVFSGMPLLPGTESYDLPALLLPHTDLLLIAAIFAGLLSLHLFALLTKQFTRRTRLLAILLFACNPLFLAVFTSLSPLTYLIPLTLLTLLAARRLFAPLFLLLAFLDPLAAVCTLLILRRKRALLFGLPVILVALLFTRPTLHAFAPSIVEFGNVLGISLFFLLLALIEGLLRWKEQRPPFLLFLLFLLLAPFFPTALAVASLVVVPYAALLLERLLRRKWALKEARSLVLLLLVCSLLFLTITQIVTISEEPPSAELTALLSTLPPGEGRILAPASYGPFISFFSRREAYVCTDCDALYKARTIDAVEPFFQQRRIRYVLLTKEMLEGGIWLHDDDGFLFVLHHSKRFSLVDETAEEQLWRYDGQYLSEPAQ